MHGDDFFILVFSLISQSGCIKSGGWCQTSIIPPQQPWLSSDWWTEILNGLKHEVMSLMRPAWLPRKILPRIGYRAGYSLTMPKPAIASLLKTRFTPSVQAWPASPPVSQSQLPCFPMQVWSVNTKVLAVSWPFCSPKNNWISQNPVFSILSLSFFLLLCTITPGRKPGSTAGVPNKWHHGRGC